MYLILLESLDHILIVSKRMTLPNNEKSIEYIENIAIPYFIANSCRLEAISCYKLLEEHYKKLRIRGRSLMMAEGMRNIYEEMFINHGGGDI